MKVIAYRKSFAVEIIMLFTLLVFSLTIFIKFLSEDNIFAILASLFFIILSLICMIDLLKTKKELILYDEEKKGLWVFYRYKYHYINIKDILLMQKESIRVKWSETKSISFYLKNKVYPVHNIMNIDEATNSLKELNINMELNKYFKEKYNGKNKR